VIAKRDSSQPWSFTTSLHNTGRGGRSFRFGYFEARMKWDAVRGAWPSFWLLSTADRYNENRPDLLTSELDIFEGYMDDYYGPTGFTGTLHRNSDNDFGIPNETRGINPAWVADMTTGFHTYAVLWTPTEVSWYFDGQLLRSVAPFDSTNQDMFLIFGMQVTSQIGGPALGAAEAKLEVDQVRVWQRA
jgi:beta-glucanase (GH16 family)